MIRIRKNGIEMSVRDENQVAAFVNNGWAICADDSRKPEPVAEAQATEEKPKQNRKRKEV